MSNFKVTQDKKSSMLTEIGRFWTVAPVWIYGWLWNDAQSLKQYRIGAQLFLKVVRGIWRSHGLKNRRFLPEFSISGPELQSEFTYGFETMHEAWLSIK